MARVHVYKFLGSPHYMPFNELNHVLWLRCNSDQDRLFLPHSCWILLMFGIFVHAAKNCGKRKSYISLMIKSTYSTGKSTKYNLKSHTKWRVETFWIAHMIPLYSWGSGYPKALRIPQESPPLDPWENRPRWSLGLFGAWSEWSDASCTQLCVLDGDVGWGRGEWRGWDTQKATELYESLNNSSCLQ